jgi:hypothetical protein
MGGLEDVPGHGGRIHPATQHRNDIGQQNEPKRPFLQNGAHPFTLKEKAGSTNFGQGSSDSRQRWGRKGHESP